MATTGNSPLIKPSAPGVLTNSLLQHTSVYKAFRGITATGFGLVATTATDNSPATFTQSALGGQLFRIAPASNPLGLTNSWTSGTDTAILHGLGRIPIGYFIVRKSAAVDVFDGLSSWNDKTIYLGTTDTSADTTIMVF